MSVDMLKLAFANQTKMTAAERLALLSLAYHHNSLNGACYPSQSTIAKDTGLSRRGVQLALDGLSKKRIIERFTGKKLTRSGSLYRLIGLQANSVRLMSENPSTEERSGYAPCGARSAHNKEQKNKYRYYKPSTEKPAGQFIKGISKNENDYRL